MTRSFFLPAPAILLLIGFAGCKSSSDSEAKPNVQPVADKKEPPPKNAPTVAVSPAKDVSPPDGALAREVIEHAKRGTVYVEARFRFVGHDQPKGDTVSLNCTGVVLSEDGLILTASGVVKTVMALDREKSLATKNHGVFATEKTSPLSLVVAVLDSVFVRVDSGTTGSKLYPAQVLCSGGDDVNSAFALLRIAPDHPLPTLKLAGKREVDALEAGRSVAVSLGFPQTFDAKQFFDMLPPPGNPEISTKAAPISRIQRDGAGKVNILEYHCEFLHGMTGGPLIGTDGKVVGFTFAPTATRTTIAIPATQVRAQFPNTLAWLGLGEDGVQNVRRPVLRVDPNDPAAHATLRLAWLEAIKRTDKPDRGGSGETISLAAGTFDLDETFGSNLISSGIRLVGAGKGKTILRCKDKTGLAIHGLQFCEISDLTMLPAAGARAATAELRIGWERGVAGPEVFVHDIELGTPGPDKNGALIIEGHSSPNVVRCDVHAHDRPESILVANSEGGKPRLQRLQIGNVGMRIGDKSSPLVEGCTFVPGASVFLPGIEVRAGAEPLIRGCRFMPGDQLLIRGSKGLYEYNDFSYHLNSAPKVLITGGSRPIFKGNFFRHPGVEAPGFDRVPPHTRPENLVVADSSHVVFSRNLLQGVRPLWTAGTTVDETGNEFLPPVQGKGVR